ncbi:MAG: hypothetical protein JRC86_05850, partial [Deltaproteobacteria bacterium]|nr:hypothetical protein [Deltaproteobacteria bacterium]
MARKKRDDTTELLPPEGDKAVGHRVFELLNVVIKDKEDRGLPKKWSRNYELGKGRHWKSRGRQNVSLVTANMLNTHRTRVTNLLTDNNPTFNVRKIGRYEEDTPDFQKLVHTTENWWRETEQQHVFEKSVMNGETYGVTIEKMPFNPDAENGLGEAETHLVDPFYFGLYPTTITNNQLAEANLHYYPKTVREVKRMWPEHADKIYSDASVLLDVGDTRSEVARGSAKGGWTSIFSNIVKSVTERADRGTGETDELLVVEAWVKDYTMETIETTIAVMNEEPEMDPAKPGEPLIDEETGKPLYTQMMDDEGTPMFESEVRPKYPGFIRCVTCCNGGEVILRDVPNPSINPELREEFPEEIKESWLYDHYPFNLAQSGTDTGSWDGIDDFSQLEALQMEVNKSLSQFTMLKDKAARLKLINPKTSGVDNAEFDNQPGIVRPVNEIVAAAIRYMDPPQIPPDILTGLEIYKDLFYQVAGSAALEQAQSGGSDVIAYKAIAALIEQASTLLRGKIRNYSKLIRDRGRCYISHVQNWYTEERFISYDENAEDMSDSIVGTDFLGVPGKLTVVSGSTMPVSKVQEREEALALFQMQAIDQEELLKRVEWPDYKTLLKRMSMGPLNAYLQKLIAMGWPEELVQLFGQISTMPDPDFQKAMKEGALPTFDDVAQQIAGTPEPEVPEKEELEKAEIGAKIEKLEAERTLIEEKVATEKV